MILLQPAPHGRRTRGSDAAGRGLSMWLSPRLLAVVLLIAAMWMPLSAQAAGSPRQVHDLKEGWSFRQGEPEGSRLPASFDDASWQRVTLPHTWNRLGEYRTRRSDATNDFQGAGWYRLQVRTPAAKRGDRHFLQFDGVGTLADVWFNGRHVGRHAGGYSAFRFDVTPFLDRSGVNELIVRADNSKPAPGSPTADILPLSGDFFPYGGLYRSVAWIVAPNLQIDLLDHAGPGVYLSTLAASADVAKIKVLTRLRNLSDRHRRVDVVTSIADEAGVTATSVSSARRVPNSGVAEVEQILTVARPRLWQGRRDPFLYRVVVELRSGGKLLDRVEQSLGIRTIRIDPDRGFFLNGQPLALHGVSRHQDSAGKGAALSDADHARDMDLIEEIGANTIRFAHYQHAGKWFELSDQRGMVAWAEIPYVSMATFDDGEPSPAVVANARQQLVELIRQNHNHPSVAVWAVGNEVDSKSLAGRPVKARGLLQELHRLARQEDPSRQTAFADCCAASPYANPGTAEELVGTTDVVGFNRYPGWYSSDPAAMGAILDKLHSRYPQVPMAVTEYGAGGALTQHTDNPAGGPINAFGRPHPEGYQSWVHEQNWLALQAREYLWATWVWNMFDFASDFRAEGDAIDLNDKGLVTFDRRVRKDAFYFYQANWSSSPVLHINGSRYVDRPYPLADISAYSNASEAYLTVNGALVGRQPCPERICTWRNVALAPGPNRIVASASMGGASLADAMTLNGPDPARDGVRINAGDLTSAILPDGRQFGSDHFFSGGEARALNPRTITALFERRGAAPKTVANAASALLHDGYREGRFRYELPLADGNWRVTVTSFEPGEGKAGRRTFSVIANGVTALASFDPFAAAGRALREVSRSFPVAVEDGRLVLSFEPITGPAVISAIEIVRR